MRRRSYLILPLVLMLLLLGCGDGDSTSDDGDHASTVAAGPEQVVTKWLTHLSNGDFEQACALEGPERKRLTLQTSGTDCANYGSAAMELFRRARVTASRKAGDVWLVDVVGENENDPNMVVSHKVVRIDGRYLVEYP